MRDWDTEQDRTPLGSKRAFRQTLELEARS
jgi:hypothetical protein